MLTLTYGFLPSREVFDCHASIADPDERGFYFHNDPRLGSGHFSAGCVWDELKRAQFDWEQGSKDAGDWCRDVLYLLKIEWI